MWECCYSWIHLNTTDVENTWSHNASSQHVGPYWLYGADFEGYFLFVLILEGTQQNFKAFIVMLKNILKVKVAWLFVLNLETVLRADDMNLL